MQDERQPEWATSTACSNAASKVDDGQVQWQTQDHER